MSKISKVQKEELQALSKQGDKAIDTSDAPELESWKNAERGRFYRPLKKQITLRIDEDVLDWFKTSGSKYQTRINSALREYVDEHQN